MKSELKNLPSGWKVVRLGEIAEKSILKNRNNSIKLVLSNSAINGLVAQNEYFDKDIANKENIQDYYIVHLGDFVYNPRISQNAPTGPINRNMFSKGIVSPLYTVFSVQDETLAKFLAYFFQTIVWQNQVKSVANYGARHDRINITDNTFFSLKILLPPLDEQEKIAEILSTWDEAINLTINLIESKKQFKKALMQNLLTAKIRFPELKDEWRETKLKDICIKMRSGGTPKSTNRKFYNGNIPFVKINDMTLAGKYIYDTQAKITEEGLENSSAWLIPKNSLIYSMYASFGFVSINKIEVATSQAMMCIVPNLSKVALEYLYYFLDDFQKNVCSFVETGTQGNLNAEIVKNFKIKLPNLNEQQKIAEVLTSCDDEINLLNLKLENLKKQKQGLMQKLLSGKVRI
jgi:restriction modification system DNA specificity domain protein